MRELAAITTMPPGHSQDNNCVDRRGNATLPTNKPRYKPRNKNAATMAWEAGRGRKGGSRAAAKSGNQNPAAGRNCNDNRQQLQSKMAEHKNSGMEQSTSRAAVCPPGP